MDWSFEKTVVLVKTITQYPILYDGTINHRKKQSAWGQIAQCIPQGSIEHCKDKWTNLKKEFMQSLKSSPPTPFALAPHMSFLLPYITIHSWLNDFEYLVKLTGLVKEHPCLYNKKEYLSRATIWQQIATNMEDGSTGVQCQYKWLRLRQKYTNALRTGIPMKPKGIDKHLQFLIDYVHLKPPAPIKVKEEVKFLYKLIDVVRGYPILYDGTKLPQCDRTWDKVAETLGKAATASDCRHKWRKLRKNFKNHLKFQTQRFQQLGLVQRLSFLKPYVKFKRPSESMHITEAERKAQLLDTFGRQCKALRIDVQDQDTMFLLNFLQDLAKMDEVQVRRFRIGAVKVAREIIDDDTFH